MSIATERTNSRPEVSTEPAAPIETPAAEVRQQVQVDDSKALSCYANFCRVTGTPEEIIMDFALNQHPIGAPPGKIEISERIICNYWTAKRFLMALHMTIERHEQAFGVLETDINKRVQAPRPR